MGRKLWEEAFGFNADTVRGADKIGKWSNFFAKKEEAIANFVVGTGFTESVACKQMIPIYIKNLSAFAWWGRGRDEWKAEVAAKCDAKLVVGETMVALEARGVKNCLRCERVSSG